MPDPSTYTPEAIASLEQFQQALGPHYEDAHFILACHAAFPAFVTPDLLYQIWKHFKTWPDERGKLRNIPMLAVSDVLLSALFRATGPNLYEMQPGIAAALTRYLAADPRFGTARIRELASLLYQYAAAQPDLPETRHLREAQQWTALMAINPAVTTQEMLKSLAEKAGSHQVNRSLGMMNLMEGFALGNEGFGKALSVHLKPANDQQQSVTQSSTPLSGQVILGMDAYLHEVEDKITLPGYVSTRLRELPISQPENHPPKTQPKQETPVKKVQVIIINISRYHHKDIPPQNPTGRQASRLARKLQEAYGERLVPVVLLDSQATQSAVTNIIRDVLQRSDENTSLFIYFSGLSTGANADTKSIMFYDYDNFISTEPGKGFLKMDDFNRLIRDSNRNQARVNLILDCAVGGTRWLPVNDKYVLLTAAYNISKEFLSHPLATGLMPISGALLNSNIQEITIKELYRHVMQSVDIPGKAHQTPALITPYANIHRQFLDGTDKSNSVLHTLLSENGYPGSGWNAFRIEHLLPEKSDPYRFLSFKKRLRLNGMMRIIAFTDMDESNRFNEILHKEIGNCGAIDIYPLDDMQESKHNIVDYDVIITTTQSTGKLRQVDPEAYVQLLMRSFAYDQLFILISGPLSSLENPANAVFDAVYYGLDISHENGVPIINSDFEVASMEELLHVSQILQTFNRHRTIIPEMEQGPPVMEAPASQSEIAPPVNAPKKSFWNRFFDLNNIWPFTSGSSGDIPKKETPTPPPKRAPRKK